MRRARVCSHEIVVPDSVAAWDAVAEDSPWEKERIESILETMQPGDILYDIGAEHGWMTVIYGQRVGGGNVVIVEPSADFWPNIRMGWELNDLGVPLLAVEAFAGTERAGPPLNTYAGSWPPSSTGPECGAMAYRHPNDHSESVPTTTIDELSRISGAPPNGITIDIEGAELTALYGARGTLIRDRPHVWVSIHPDLMERDFGHSPHELHSYMQHLQYSGVHLRTDHEQHWHFTPK